MVFRSLLIFTLLLLQPAFAQGSLFEGEPPVKAVVFEDDFESSLLRGRPDPAW